MRRFFVSPEDIGESNIVIDDRDDLHHMRKVLRLTEGDRLDVSDSVEWEYSTEITYIDDERAEVRILDKQRFTSEPDTRITLFQGIPKQGKMDLIVQKAVELGAEKIVPVFMARTVVTDKGNFTKKIHRWQKIADETVKQCKRGIIPEISQAVKLSQAIDMFCEFDMVLFPYENEEGTTIKEVLRKADCRKIAVIIGPEGGFAQEEAESIVRAGGSSVSLGKTVLRTETAGIAAISMIMYEFEL